MAHFLTGATLALCTKAEWPRYRRIQRPRGTTVLFVALGMLLVTACADDKKAKTASTPAPTPKSSDAAEAAEGFDRFCQLGTGTSVATEAEFSEMFKKLCSNGVANDSVTTVMKKAYTGRGSPQVYQVGEDNAQPSSKTTVGSHVIAAIELPIKAKDYMSKVAAKISSSKTAEESGLQAEAGDSLSVKQVKKLSSEEDFFTAGARVSYTYQRTMGEDVVDFAYSANVERWTFDAKAGVYLITSRTSNGKAYVKDDVVYSVVFQEDKKAYIISQFRSTVDRRSKSVKLARADLQEWYSARLKVMHQNASKFSAATKANTQKDDDD